MTNETECYELPKSLSVEFTTRPVKKVEQCLICNGVGEWKQLDLVKLNIVDRGETYGYLTSSNGSTKCMPVLAQLQIELTCKVNTLFPIWLINRTGSQLKLCIPHPEHVIFCKALLLYEHYEHEQKTLYLSLTSYGNYRQGFYTIEELWDKALPNQYHILPPGTPMAIVRDYMIDTLGKDDNETDLEIGLMLI